MQNKKVRNLYPLNLQFFAEGGAVNGAGGDGAGAGTGAAQGQGQQETQTPEIDYQKIADLVNGKLSVTEDTVLKSYFKQQGLTPEEASQAIAAFKEQKAATQPNVEALQQQTTLAQNQARQALIERDAFMLSGELGIDLKTMPYVLKMADISAVVGEDGKVNQDKLKEALNKVLEDIPQLKPNTDVQQSGFRQIGVGNTQQQFDDPPNLEYHKTVIGDYTCHNGEYKGK